MISMRNRIGLHGAYFLGMAGIGFTLPYLPLYLTREGLSDRSIGFVSTLAALASLVQYPVGIWSDRLARRKPFLLVAFGTLAGATFLLRRDHNPFLLGVLVILFAENGVCRAVVESLTGAVASASAPLGETASALGALRFWKPTGIVLMALAGSWIARTQGIAAILVPLIVIQSLAFVFVMFLQESPYDAGVRRDITTSAQRAGGTWNDAALWTFILAMVLFHVANAPGGLYLSLHMQRSLGATDSMIPYAFIMSMCAWLVVVRPVGVLADRWGRRPLLIAAWAIMSLRLALAALATTPWQLIMNQSLDGVANAMFAVLAAAWVTDRLDDPSRAGEAQAIVGTSLVLGSAIGPAASALVVDAVGYRGLFLILAGVGAVATLVIAFFIPETLVLSTRLDDRDAPALQPLHASTLGDVPASSS